MVDEYSEALQDEADPAGAPDLTSVAFDVAAAFDRLPERGVPFRCHVPASFFTGPRAERYREVSNPGLNRSDNHLQGVQRYRDRIYLSAGDLMEGCAHLFIARVGAAGGGGAAGSSDAAGGDAADSTARLTRIVCLDDRRDHSGGMQRLGNVLAIAIEGHGVGSTVVFLQLDEPDQPVWIPGARIERAETKASAAALTVLPLPAGNRVLAGVTWVQPGRLFGLLRKPRAYLDLYLSRSADLRAGFLPQLVRVDASRLVETPPPWQAISFFDPGRPGEVALIGTRSTSSAPGGTPLADLCRLRFRGDVAASWPDVDVALEHVRTRSFRFDREFGDFAAGAGIEFDPSGALVLLATSHFRHADGFRLSVASGAAAPVV